MRYLFLILILLSSCTKKKVILEKMELLSLAQSGDPKAQFVIPEKIDAGIKCNDYSEGCVGGHKLRIKGVDLIAVEFRTIDQAVHEAHRLKQVSVMNWLLDDVKGEPVLEDFFEKHLQYDPTKRIGPSHEVPSGSKEASHK